MIRAGLALLVVGGSATGVAAQQVARETLNERATLVRVIDSIAAEHIDAGTLAGLTVGVMRGADTLLLEARGYADLEWDVPMPTDAIHEIGSVTKQFTSVAALQLWSEGLLDLDADLTDVLPDYDTQGRRIPLRRLFDHTSGIKGYTEMPAFGQIAPQALPRDSLVALFEAEPFEFEPGHALIYNNSAYFLLGLIIERVSGQEYAEYLAEHVFPRAGLANTTYCSNRTVVSGRAHGYSASPDGLVRADYLDHTWPFAAGSLCSTVGDLLAWNRALHGGSVLPDSAYAELVTPTPLADGTPIRYAKGITHHQVPSGRVIEHGGGIPGFLSHSRYYPDHDVSVVVLVNTTGPVAPSAVADAVGERLFGTDGAPLAAPPPTDLGRFAGSFRGPARGREITVSVSLEDGALTLSGAGGPPRQIEFLGGSTFFFDGTRLTFEERNGAVERLRIDQVSGHYVLERVDEGR